MFPCWFSVWLIYSLRVSGVLKSPTIIVLLLVFPFILVSICLTYCGVPMMGAYIFIIVISSSWMIFWSLCTLFSVFISKSILSDMSIATSAFFWFLFAWNIFLQPYTFSLCPLFWGGSLVDSIYRGLDFVSTELVVLILEKKKHITISSEKAWTQIADSWILPHTSSFSPVLPPAPIPNPLVQGHL